MAEEVEREIPHVRSKDYQVVYSNFAQPGRSSWDIAILFAQVGESEPATPAVIDQVTVIMTPPLAKALVAVLNAHLKDYERENGEIAIPESVKRVSRERAQKLASDPSASASDPPSPPKPSLSNPESTQRQFQERPSDKPIPKAEGFSPEKS